MTLLRLLKSIVCLKSWTLTPFMKWFFSFGKLNFHSLVNLSVPCDISRISTIGFSPWILLVSIVSLLGFIKDCIFLFEFCLPCCFPFLCYSLKCILLIVIHVRGFIFKLLCILSFEFQCQAWYIYIYLCIIVNFLLSLPKVSTNTHSFSDYSIGILFSLLYLPLSQISCLGNLQVS